MDSDSIVAVEYIPALLIFRQARVGKRPICLG